MMEYLKRKLKEALDKYFVQILTIALVGLSYFLYDYVKNIFAVPAQVKQNTEMIVAIQKQLHTLDSSIKAHKKVIISDSTLLKMRLDRDSSFLAQDWQLFIDHGWVKLHNY